jgi:hypothetical protein
MEAFVYDVVENNIHEELVSIVLKKYGKKEE